MNAAWATWDAAGNRYVVVDGVAVTPDAARDLSQGHAADGVLEVLVVEGATARVRVWNPDGSTAELSGNGARIAAAWLARRSGRAEVELVFEERTVRARVAGASVRVELGTVAVGEAERLDVGGELVELTAVSVGNPHAVVRAEPERETLLRLGPAVERHPRFPERTNVQLARVDGPHDLTVRVWERGAGETAASGSSAVAAAAAAIAAGWCASPVTVHMPGGDLHVELDAERRAALTGPAVELERGPLTDLDG